MHPHHPLGELSNLLLISQQQRRIIDQRPSDRHPLRPGSACITCLDNPTGVADPSSTAWQQRAVPADQCSADVTPLRQERT